MIKERLISGLIAFLLIAVFQPWGLTEFGWFRLVLLAGIGVLIACICVLSELVLRYIVRLPNDISRGPKYIIKRNIAYQLINIVLLTAGLSWYLDAFVCNETVDNHWSLLNTSIVLGIAIGIAVVLGLYWRNVYWKRHYMRELQDANRLNGILQERARIESIKAKTRANTAPVGKDEEDNEKSADSSDEMGEKVIHLEGSTKESADFSVADFLYAESEGNYVSVHYIKEGKEQKAEIRTSMKSMESMLCMESSIMQCHRAYIVGLRHVSKVEGRSSGIGLALKHTDMIVPVSKAYVTEVKERIQNPS